MAAKIRDYKIEYAKRKARAIIKAHEEKRGKPLSANYKRRVERGLLKGKTLQQARGHKPQEHIERKQHEIEKFGLTKPQLRAVKEWSERRQGIVKDHDFEVQEVIDITIANGFDWFLNYRKIWNAARHTYIVENRRGKYASRGMSYLQSLTDDANAPELSWLYYH